MWVEEARVASTRWRADDGKDEDGQRHSGHQKLHWHDWSLAAELALRLGEKASSLSQSANDECLRAVGASEIHAEGEVEARRQPEVRG